MGIFGAPHDTFFGVLFQRPEASADWLRSVLPTRVARAIAWRTFARASERSYGLRLRRGDSDQVYVARVQKGSGRVAFVLEHKAKRDPDLPSQTLRYAVDLRHAGRRGPKTPEPLVIAAVLHHGKKPWQAMPHPHLAALPSAVGQAFGDLQPRLPLVVDDLTVQDEPALLARRLLPTTQLALLCLRFLQHFKGRDVLAALERWAHLLRAAHRRHGQDVIDALCMYAFTVSGVRRKPLADLITRILHRPKDMTMTTAQRIYSQGLTKGLTKGRVEGRAEGKVLGRADTLLRLLARRFGPLPAAITRRVRSASAAQLGRWTDRILDAATLAEVFEA